MNTLMDKARLAAFVDGELSPEEAAEIVLHLADTPQDQAYVDDLAAANQMLADAFSDPLHDPVPEAIHAIIFPRPVPEARQTPRGATANILAFPRRAILVSTGLAIAAALAGVALAIALTTEQNAELLTLGPLPEGSAPYAAFQTLSSGQPQALTDDAELMVQGSFRLADGRLCREFDVLLFSKNELDYGIVCKSADRPWTVEVLARERLPAGEDGEGFSAASGAEAHAITHFLNRTGAGDLLPPDVETSLIETGWKP